MPVPALRGNGLFLRRWKGFWSVPSQPVTKYTPPRPKPPQIVTGDAKTPTHDTRHGSPNPYRKAVFRFKASGCLSGAFCSIPLASIEGVYTSGQKAVQACLAGLCDPSFILDKTRIPSASDHPPRKPPIFQVIFGFCHVNIEKPAPCAFLRQSAGMCVIVGES